MQDVLRLKPSPLASGCCYTHCCYDHYVPTAPCRPQYGNSSIFIAVVLQGGTYGVAYKQNLERIVCVHNLTCKYRMSTCAVSSSLAQGVYYVAFHLLRFVSYHGLVPLACGYVVAVKQFHPDSVAFPPPAPPTLRVKVGILCVCNFYSHNF